MASLSLAALIGAAIHTYQHKEHADTRGNGGFQYENTMGDMAIGIAGVLCARLRGYFWLAVILVASIQYFGDAGGHIYFWLAEDNTKPDNIGFPLYLDFLQPIIAILLYWMSWNRAGDA